MTIANRCEIISYLKVKISYRVIPFEMFNMHVNHDCLSVYCVSIYICNDDEPNSIPLNLSRNLDIHFKLLSDWAHLSKVQNPSLRTPEFSSSLSHVVVAQWSRTTQLWNTNKNNTPHY